MAVDNGDGLQLNGTALRALVSAVEFQLAAWRSKRIGELDEDDWADLQNDIQYLEILLDQLRSESRRTDPLHP